MTMIQRSVIKTRPFQVAIAAVLSAVLVWLPLGAFAEQHHADPAETCVDVPGNTLIASGGSDPDGSWPSGQPAIPLGNPDQGAPRGDSGSDYLHLKKSGSYHPETGRLDITLEAFAAGPCPTIDTVLVLDQSMSMDAQTHAGMVKAATAFIDGIKGNAASYGLAHRVGIVFYCGNRKLTPLPLSNNYSELKKYLSTLNLPHDLTKDAATRIDIGLGEAHKLLGESVSESALVLFAGGMPGMDGELTFDQTTANQAIKKAEEIKNRGTRIFTVGIFDGANGQVMHGDEANHSIYNYESYSINQTGSFWESQSGRPGDAEYPMANRTMNLISSNFGGQLDHENPLSLFRDNENKERVEIQQAYQLGQSGHYLTAGRDAGQSLLRIFGDLAQEVTPQPDLAPGSVIQDVLSPPFSLSGTGGQPCVRFADCLGFDETTEEYRFAAPCEDPESGVACHVENGELVITGFDFKDNFVTRRPKTPSFNDWGRKLIVTLTAGTDPGFFGGNRVKTNTDRCGIMLPDGTPAKLFESLAIDVPLKYQVMEKIQETIYLGQETDLGPKINFVTLGGINYEPDGFNNSHVTIRYDLYSQGASIGRFEIAPGCHQSTVNWTGAQVRPNLEVSDYLLKVTIQPAQPGTCLPVTLSSGFSFDVKTCALTITKAFKPETPVRQGESFLFSVSDGDHSWPLRVGAGESVTLIGLPVGTYRVTEQYSWSWRYVPSESSALSQTVTLGAGEDDDYASVFFTSEKRPIGWLSGEQTFRYLFRFQGGGQP